MSVVTSRLHIFRVFTQVVTNLVQLQRDINQNATAWLAQANAQSAPLATLQGGIASAIAQYEVRLGWVSTVMADATNFPNVQALLEALGGTAADVNALYTALDNVVAQMGAANVSSYANIEAGCNSLIAACPAPVSLWPE